jgi:predicted O-linked N-acetylglucosamine transferase (SPINDLY family)
MEAVNQGINANRLVFASYEPISEHLNRIKYADLFLDTRPYNAHTTSSDALRDWPTSFDMYWKIFS